MKVEFEISRYLATLSAPRIRMVLGTMVLCLLSTLAVQSAAISQLSIDGDNLTATTTNVMAVFKGADLVRLRNRLTGEDYIHTSTPGQPMLNLNMVSPPIATRYVSVGGWHKGSGIAASTLTGNSDAAQIHFRDLVRNIIVNVVIEPETQDITVTMLASASKEGVTGLTWGFRGIDLTGGYFAIPAEGGVRLDAASMPEHVEFKYPGNWEAQMAVWQGKEGGFVLYTRDERVRFKRFKMDRRGNYSDLSVITDSLGSQKLAGDVPQVEWRLNTFRGDWRVPAGGYRNLMNFYRKPVGAPMERAWIKVVRSMISFTSNDFDPATLEKLSKELDPAKTLLYLTNWRKSAPAENLPDNEVNEKLPSFVERAHAQGFHVMLKVDPLFVSEKSAEFAKCKELLALSPIDDKPIFAVGHNGSRLAKLNPVFPEIREMIARNLKALVDNLQIDGFMINDSVKAENDGFGLVGKKNSAEGMVALERRLMTLCPGVVIGNDGMNELLSPYSFVSVRKPNEFVPHPISAFLFSEHVLSFADVPSISGEDRQTFLANIGQFESQAVQPTLNISDMMPFRATEHDTKLILSLSNVWNEGQYMPDFIFFKPGDLMRWGSNAGEVAILPVGGGSTVKHGEEVLYNRISGISSIVTASSIYNWIGYNENGIIGLDPKRSYLLEKISTPKDELHVSSVSPGVMLENVHKTSKSVEITLAGNRASVASTPASFQVTLSSKGSASISNDVKPNKVENGIAYYEGVKLPVKLTFDLNSAN